MNDFFAWWHYLLFVFALSAIGFAVLKFIKSRKSKKKIFVDTSHQESASNIAQQLKQLESNLIHEIRYASSKSLDNSGEINRLNNEINNLKIENTKIKSVKQNLDSTINQLKNEKNNLEGSINSITTERNQKINELFQLKEKIISVDYLTGYCDSVLAYFKLCNQISSEAFDYFNRVSQQNLQHAFAVGHLLMKFQNSINLIPVGNWIQIVQDIKDTGITNSKQIKSSFKQLENVDDRKKQFQRLLFSEVLVKYSSSILILAEAFRNLDHFQVSSEIVNDVQSNFAKHVPELYNKVKSTGLENKYVPLFRNYEEFLGQIESVDSEKSSAYKEVTGLKKGSIAEIVSYGVKTSFEETKTLIILE